MCVRLRCLSSVRFHETIDHMIVHQPNCLHVCINDRAADEAETTLLEILRQYVTLRGRGRNLGHRAPMIHFLYSTDKLPDVAVERTKLFLDREKGLRVGHRRVDFEPVANDAWILQQQGFLLRGESRHLPGIELRKCPAIATTPQQDRFPCEAGLGSL